MLVPNGGRQSHGEVGTERGALGGELNDSAHPVGSSPIRAYSIRVMQNSDLEGVLDLLLRTPEVSILPTETRAQFEKVLERNPGFARVALDAAGRVIGCSFAGHNGIRGSFHHVAVDPSFRGQGIGRELVSAAFPRFIQDGVTRVYAMTGPTNEGSKNFWIKMGFRFSTPPDDGKIVVLTIDLK